MKLNRKHTAWYALAAMMVLSFATRLLFLNHPNQVVFDEVHFGKFATAYCCSHERFFDIHPPHSKLFIAAGGSLFGYRGGFDFEHIGKSYEGISAWKLRIVPALAGALLPLVIWGLLRVVGVSQGFALVGALVVTLDNALIVQSRLIGLDSLLLLFEFGAILFALLAIREKRSKHAFYFLIGAGVLAGCAAGTKFTGLAALLLVGFVVLLASAQVYSSGKPFRVALRTFIVRSITVLLAAAAAYLLGWALHFSLLTNPGSGDAWGVPTGNFWQDVTKAHQTMLDANYNLQAKHPYESKWWQWPLMARSVFYWAGDQGQWIYFLGNPTVWLGSSILLLALVLQRFFMRVVGHRYLESGVPDYGFLVFSFGYIVSLAPLVLVPRALFLYHYLTPLIFAVLLTVWWLESYKKKLLTPTISSLILLLIVVGFILVLPITYGFDAWQATLMRIVPVWR